MKKTLLSVSCLLFSIASVFSQADFTLLPSDTISFSQTLNSGDLAEGFIKVKNISNSSKTFKWICTDKTGPHAWEANVCDIVNCYTFSYVIRTFTLNAGDTGTMRLDVDPYGASGTGTLSLMMWVDGDSTGKVKYPSWNVDITVVNGIGNVTANTLKVFPNPVKQSFVVSGLENAGNLSFEVYDMKGATVKSEIKNATNSTIEISIENLPAGTYLLKAIDENNNVTGTARLSKVD